MAEERHARKDLNKIDDELKNDEKQMKYEEDSGDTNGNTGDKKEVDAEDDRTEEDKLERAVERAKKKVDEEEKKKKDLKEKMKVKVLEV